MTQPLSLPVDTTLKAFIAYDEYDTQILFTRSRAEAEDRAEQPVSRADHLDQFAAQGWVPAELLLEKHNWRFECRHCGAELDADREVFDEDDQLREDIDLVFVQDHVYCCPGCVLKAAAAIAERQHSDKQLLDGLLSRFPGVTPGETMQLVGVPVPSINFTFPGGKYGGRWDLGDELVWISPADQEAWRAFKSTLPA